MKREAILLIADYIFTAHSLEKTRAFYFSYVDISFISYWLISTFIRLPCSYNQTAFFIGIKQ